MPEQNKKPRGVVGALSNEVAALRGQIEDFRDQMAAVKELVGASLRDGNVGTSAHFQSFTEFVGTALTAFIQSAGYGSVGRDSVQNTMEALVDVYKGYLCFCGAPASMLDEADRRRDEGTKRLNEMWAKHRSSIAAKGGWGDGTEIQSIEDLHTRTTNRNAMEVIHAEDPSTWGVDLEAEAFLGPAE